MSEGHPDGDVLSLRIEGEASVTATLDDHRVRLEHPGAPPLVAAVPRPALGEAIAAELRALSMETAFHDAVMALARRMAWLRTGPASLA
jgi:hypothetical protein